jgi:hypothetical protein
MRRAIFALAALLFIASTARPDALAQPMSPIPGTRPPSTALCPQWWLTARSVGWPEHTLPTLDRIIWRESRCRPDVENLRDPWGGSVGLAQVNRGWVRWLRELGVIDHSSDLFSGRTNLEAALAIYDYACAAHGECWIAWGIRTA